MTQSRQKEVSFSKLIVKDGEYVYQIEQWLKVYDAVLDKWNFTNKRVTYQSVPEHDGCSKSLTFQAIIEKPMINTFEPRSGFFLARFTARIPEDDPRYKNVWLKKSGMNIIVSVLPNHAYALSLKDEKIAIVEQVGKQKRVSEKRAREILEAKEAFFVKKYGDTYQFCAYEARV